jgi:peptidoglycan/xylan/chitin deacetylase (PgdA/CDA1 family)
MEPDLRCPERRIRLLDDDRYFERFTGLLRKHDVPLTSFTVMSAAPDYADRLNALAQTIPVEFAVHSYSHDTKNPASKDEVRRSWETYGEIWNAQPQGYRTPNCLIDAQGIENLAEQGYRYDSSIVPSVRPDGYAYNNARFGRNPFRFSTPGGSLVELPVACLAGIRLPFIFSYVKLVGLALYRAALAGFPLPEIVVTYLHPYDLYVGEIAQHIPGWKRYAHSRNSGRAFELLDDLIATLKLHGYAFALMGNVATAIEAAGAPLRTF